MSVQAQKLGEWRVFETAEAVADHTAEWICNLACSSPGRFSVCLSGGSTPRILYQRLAGEFYLSRFPWNRVDWFWGDERFVAQVDPRSNFRMAWEAFLSRVPVREDRIHAIHTKYSSPEQAAAAYEAELQVYYGSERLDRARPLFDVTLLGVGENGHTASLFPGSPALLEHHRWALAVVGEAQEPRVTLTYPVLDSSHNVAFLVTGARKTEVLAEIRAGDSVAPAARVHPNGHLWWFADRAALPTEA